MSGNTAKLKKDKRRIEAIINHMSEAVIGLDEDEHFLFINSKAEELTGLKSDDLAGQSAVQIASTNNLVQKLIQDSIDDNNHSKQDDEEINIIEIVSDSGQISYYSKETIPVTYTGTEKQIEKKIGSIITLKNVTRFQEIHEAKTDFIAVVSHELKTPIASIDMSVRLLKDKRVGPLNNEQKELVKSIDEDTQRMRNKARDLLDFSKIETGNIQLNIRKENPDNLIEYAYETMIKQVQQKNIQMYFVCDEKLPRIKADLQKTVWVLVNLISNAMRYTSPKGFIKLKAEEMEQVIKFSVTDSGKGISPEFLDKIFQKHFQVNDQNGTGGSGLGLSIAKKFINAQNGNIGVESELGQGSTFYFTLPKA